MAKITPSMIISQVSGKVAGSVFTSSPNGLQVRPRAKVKNKPQNGFIKTKQWMSIFSGAWRELTNAERAAWIAETANYTKPDRLGNTITLTGMQLYCEIGMANRLGGTPWNATPPTPASYPINSGLSLTMDTGVGMFAETNWASAPIASNIVVYATAPSSPGKMSYSISDLKWISAYPNDDPLQIEFTGEYEALFGPIANNVGKKVFVELWICPTGFSDRIRPLLSGFDFIVT